jgi:hypothetical protein
VSLTISAFVWQLTDAKMLVKEHRLEYNHKKPHRSLGYMTPAAFATEYRQLSNRSWCIEIE